MLDYNSRVHIILIGAPPLTAHPLPIPHLSNPLLYLLADGGAVLIIRVVCVELRTDMIRSLIVERVDSDLVLEAGANKNANGFINRSAEGFLFYRCHHNEDDDGELFEKWQHLF